jgi:hypothetical protein
LHTDSHACNKHFLGNPCWHCHQKGRAFDLTRCLEGPAAFAAAHFVALEICAVQDALWAQKCPKFHEGGNEDDRPPPRGTTKKSVCPLSPLFAPDVAFAHRTILPPPSCLFCAGKVTQDESIEPVKKNRSQHTQTRKLGSTPTWGVEPSFLKNGMLMMARIKVS